MQFFSFEPIIGNRAQIRRSILVNHSMLCLFYPNHEIQCLALRKCRVAFFKGRVNEMIAYCTWHVMKKQPFWHAARFRHPTSLCDKTPVAKPLLLQRSGFSQKSVRLSRIIYHHFFSPEHNPAILIYIWPCSNIGFLFEDKLQGTLRVKKA